MQVTTMRLLTKFALLVLLYPAATLAMNCKGCTPLVRKCTT